MSSDKDERDLFYHERKKQRQSDPVLRNDVLFLDLFENQNIPALSSFVDLSPNEVKEIFQALLRKLRYPSPTLRSHHFCLARCETLKEQILHLFSLVQFEHPTAGYNYAARFFPDQKSAEYKSCYAHLQILLVSAYNEVSCDNKESFLSINSNTKHTYFGHPSNEHFCFFNQQTNTTVKGRLQKILKDADVHMQNTFKAMSLFRCVHSLIRGLEHNLAQLDCIKIADSDKHTQSDQQDILLDKIEQFAGKLQSLELFSPASCNNHMCFLETNFASDDFVCRYSPIYKHYLLRFREQRDRTIPRLILKVEALIHSKYND